jgi:pimeloyl-ACP methyl ester carboxylesterase
MRHSAAGVEIEVRDDGEGVPVLFLHGNPDAGDTWDGVVERLSGLRLIRPDMPGFGDSPEPAADFDYLPESTVPMWDALADALELDSIVVVVHDFGGPWLLPWVARNPGRVRGLVVCNTLYSPAYRRHFWARVWQTRGLGEFTTWVGPRALYRWEMRRGSRGLPVSYCDACCDKSTPGMRRSVLRTYRAHSDPRTVFAEELPRLQQSLAGPPTRVVWGVADPYISTSEATIFGTTPTLLDGVGHWVAVERPDAVADAVREVLAAG